MSSLSGTPPRSALLAAWGNAWLAGDTGLPELVSRVTAYDDLHSVVGLAVDDLPLERAVARLRAAGVTRLRVVLPAPGDALGLPGHYLHDAEHDLRRGLLECVGALRDLDVARWRPDVADALADLRTQARRGLDADELPDGYPQRARDLLVQARSLAGVLQLAGQDTGGAVDSREAAAREAALRELARLVRRARLAAYNSYGQLDRESA